MTTRVVGAGDEGHLAVTCMWVCEFFSIVPVLCIKMELVLVLIDYFLNFD